MRQSNGNLGVKSRPVRGKAKNRDDSSRVDIQSDESDTPSEPNKRPLREQDELEPRAHSSQRTPKAMRSAASRAIETTPMREPSVASGDVAINPMSGSGHIFSGTNVPVSVTPYKGVTLEEFTPKAIRAFMDARVMEYNLVHERQMNGDNIFLLPLAHSINPKIMSAIANFELRKPLDKIVEQDLEEVLQNALRTQEWEITLNKDIFRSVMFDERLPAGERVFKAFQQIQNILDDKGYSNVLDRPEVFKFIGRAIIDRVRPEPVRERIRAEEALWLRQSGVQRTIADYYRNIKDWSEAYAAFHPNRQQQRPIEPTTTKICQKCNRKGHTSAECRTFPARHEAGHRPRHEKPENGTQNHATMPTTTGKAPQHWKPRNPNSDPTKKPTPAAANRVELSKP